MTEKQFPDITFNSVTYKYLNKDVSCIKCSFFGEFHCCLIECGSIGIYVKSDEVEDK